MMQPGEPQKGPDTAKTENRENWWRCFFEQSEEAQVVCGRDGVIFEANQKAVHLLGTPDGRSPSSLLGALSDATSQKLALYLKRLKNRQENIQSVSVFRGGQLSLLADLQIAPLGEGASLVTFKDASRRWRMESHMQRLMTAVDASPDVIFLTDRDNKIVFVNAAFQTLTGYTIEDVLGRSSDFLRDPSSRSAMNAYLECVSQGAGWKGELLNRRSDGTAYPVETTISPIFNNDGECVGHAAFERDVAVRKQLEMELRLERNHLFSIMNSLDAAVYTMDRRFRLSHINQGWKKMPAHHGWLDMSQPPQAGRHFLEYVDTEARRAELRAVFEAVLTSAQTQEIQAGPVEGKYWTIKVAPWMNGGVVQGLIYIVADQTRFHELQRQLYQAQKMETIGALAAGVAHDFNNLLQAIRGNVSLVLLQDAVPELLRHPLQQIEQAASRAADITQQLLSFSRASDEKATVLDLNEVIKEASHLAQRAMMSKVDLQLNPHEEPLKVRMDCTRAQQLLLNLCVNALDAMAKGGCLSISNLSVKLTPDQAAKARSITGAEFARCSVSDTGSGIPTEVLDRIFDPFFTTKEKGKGTGLGLSIAQTAVAQANGFIEVESVIGQGTTFHVFLPRIRDELVLKEEKKQKELSKGTGRVMVVDDLDLVLDFTRAFLETVGYEVLSAVSAEEALKLLALQEKGVDLIFTDYNMPGMNGLQLIQEVGSRFPNMRFILASGYLEDAERAILTQCPNVRVLDKPFNMKDAANVISEMLAWR